MILRAKKSQSGRVGGQPSTDVSRTSGLVLRDILDVAITSHINLMVRHAHDAKVRGTRDQCTMWPLPPT